MALDLRSMELFVRIAAVGAIGKAGAEFGLSRTAATQRIQALEDNVGVQLFHRTTRTVSLTSDGEIFLDHAKRIIENVEEALSDAHNDPRTIRGDLRIACPASFGKRHVAPYVAEFLETHPKVAVHLHLSDAVVDIVEQGFDMAIRLGELATSSLKARRLAASPRVVVATPGYIERHGAPEMPDDLKAHNCLMRGDVRSWKLTAPDGSAVDAKVSGNFTSDSAEAVTELALSGIGVARKCRWEIAEHLESGRLVTVLDDYTVAPVWSVFAVRSPSRLPPTRVRAFTDYLKGTLDAVPALALN